jgi:AcrR family transcriptional regulator
MASSVPARFPSLQPADWIQAALVRLAKHGLDEVRVELLARDLGVSKGSFYWHFRDRTDLREQMLAAWESSELSWIDDRGSNLGTASRWANFIARGSDRQRIRLEAGMRAWAREDEKVARTLASIDLRRAHFIAEVLADVGFSFKSAQAWSEMVLLLCLGWADRAARNSSAHLESRGLGELLSDMILAASAGSSARHEP